MDVSVKLFNFYSLSRILNDVTNVNLLPGLRIVYKGCLIILRYYCRRTLRNTHVVSTVLSYRHHLNFVRFFPFIQILMLGSLCNFTHFYMARGECTRLVLDFYFRYCLAAFDNRFNALFGFKKHGASIIFLALNLLLLEINLMVFKRDILRYIDASLRLNYAWLVKGRPLIYSSMLYVQNRIFKLIHGHRGLTFGVVVINLLDRSEGHLKIVVILTQYLLFIQGLLKFELVLI